MYIADCEGGGLDVDKAAFDAGELSDNDMEGVDLSEIRHQEAFYIEDASGRAKLSIPDGCDLVTGVVCAVVGAEAEDGTFHVIDIIVPGLPPQPLPPTPLSSSSHLLAAVCGLNMTASGTTAGSTDGASVLRALVGTLRAPQGAALAKAIGRFVVIGPSLAPVDAWYDTRRVRLGALCGAFDPAAVAAADAVIAALGDVAPVEVIPGAFDPTSAFLPQQPIHPCVLPRTASKAGAVLGTNPHWTVVGADENNDAAKAGGIDVLVADVTAAADVVRWRGSRRRNAMVDDATAEDPTVVPKAEGTSHEDACANKRSSRSRSRSPVPESVAARAPGGAVATDDLLDAAISLLMWRQLAPTAPDTLATHPLGCGADDKLVLSASPHVFIVGGSASFGTVVAYPPVAEGADVCSAEAVTEGSADARLTRVVAVPTLAASPGLVLVDLSSPTFATKFVPIAVRRGA